MLLSLIALFLAFPTRIPSRPNLLAMLLEIRDRVSPVAGPLGRTLGLD